MCNKFKSFQSNQPIPNPDHDRTGQPVVGTNTRTAQDGRKTSRSQEIDARSFHEEAVKNDRTGQPVVNSDESSHEQTTERGKHGLPNSRITTFRCEAS